MDMLTALVLAFLAWCVVGTAIVLIHHLFRRRFTAMNLETRWFQGNFEPTTSDDPRIYAGQIVDTETGDVLARASLVNTIWGVSFYGELRERFGGSSTTFTQAETNQVIALFKSLAGEGVSP